MIIFATYDLLNITGIFIFYKEARNIPAKAKFYLICFAYVLSILPDALSFAAGVWQVTTVMIMLNVDLG